MVMILPCGTVIFENLTTAMVNIEGLIDQLEKRAFTGYIAMTADNFSGTLFLRSGRPVNVVKDGDGKMVGRAALSAIMQRCKSDDVRIDVHEISEELVNALIRFANSKMIYEDLRSDFVSLDKLLVTLGQQQHTGHLEVAMGSEIGMILLERGFPIDAIYRMADGTTVAGAESLNEIMEATKKKDTVINVYQSEDEGEDGDIDDIMAASEVINIDRVIEVYGEIISRMEKSIDKLLGKGKFTREFAFAMKLRGPEGLTYRDGVLDYKGDLLRQDLVNTLNTVLDETITGLSHIISRRAIVSNLRANIKDFTELYGGDIDRFGIYGVLGE